MGVLSPEQLLQELTEHNDFFDLLVDMIPAKLYISGQSGDDFNPRYHKTAAEDSKEARRAARKTAKRAKLDPTAAESTTQKKKRLEETSIVLPVAAAPSSSTSTTSRIDALREKLHAKIASMQTRPKNASEVSKRAARRADKLRRQEEAARRKLSKTKVGGASTTYQMPSAASTETTAAEDLASVDFGRLSGLNTKASNNYAESNKALANLNKTKNLQKMLQDAEAKRQKLEALKASQSQEDQAKAIDMQWADTLKEADGQRVKDDPAKIRQTLKRKAAKKAKSQKAWKSRMEQTSAKKDERQKIREHNLQARKIGGKVGANLSKKRIETGEEEKGKRRLSRAGFEGRKQDFINSGKSKGKQ